MSHERRQSNAVPVVFGDVAMLRFGDGDEVLGGQAFAIAWHLQGLGVPARLITRLGDDGAGRAALRAMEQWGLDTYGVQAAHGSVSVPARVAAHSATSWIRVPPDQPWDRISAEEALEAVPTAACALIVHGARALRGASNPRVLDDLIDACASPVFFDATADVGVLERPELERCFTRSAWIAIRERDLPAVAARLGIECTQAGRLAERLREAYEIAVLFVITAVEGAYAVTGDERHPVVVPRGDLDTVDCIGVEEAFSTVAAYGSMADWPLTTCLRRAQGFAELIAALPMPEIPTGVLYDDVLAQWAAEAEHEAIPSTERSPVRAAAPISKQARLPAELEKAARELEALRQRKASARMKAAAVSQGDATRDDPASRTALARARRSLERLEARVDEAERRLRSLRQGSGAQRGLPSMHDASTTAC